MLLIKFIQCSSNWRYCCTTHCNFIKKEYNKLSIFKKVLDNAEYVIAHNAKFDIAWLREIGIDCRTKFIDTMISEYVLDKGIRNKRSLKALADKYNVTRKQDSLKEAFNKGLNYSDMSEEDQQLYLYYDIIATAEVYEAQEKRFKKNSNRS